jgi:uncharacterized protein (TIGR02996 family)
MESVTAKVVKSMNPRAELEAAIDADPYDPRPYAVYGDHLQELGDPRGELIALHLANATDPDPQLDTATRALLRRHPPLLPTDTGGHLRWQCGFIRRAEVPASSLPALLAHPSSRFLAELAIFLSNDFEPAVAALSAHALLSLRELAFGAERPLELAHAPIELADLLEWPDKPADLSAIWSCIPNLERLRVLDGTHTLGMFDLPNLVELEMRTTTAEPYLSALANAEWPRLERVDIGLAMVDWRPPVLAHLRRLLLEAPPPKLLHVGLRGARRLLFDALSDPAELAAALGRLRSLDLTRNLLLDDDAELLARSGIRLERLDVSRNQLTADAIASLSTISATVIADDQYSPDDDPIEGLYDY